MTANWFTNSSPSETDRLEGAWSDAPTENVELCSMLLDLAREQVIAYAPEPETTEGTIEPGAVTVTRTNLFTNPNVVNLNGINASPGQATVAHTGTAARWTIATTSSVGISTAVTDTPGVLSRILLRARANRPLTAVARIKSAQGPNVTIGTDWGWFELTTTSGNGSSAQSGFILNSGAGHVASDWIEIDRVLFTSGGAAGPHFSGSTPDAVIDGITYDYAWTGAENASQSVETYRPDVFIPTYPDRLVYAQLMQAKDLWNAGRSNVDGVIGPSDYSFTPKSLSKTIRGIIRPASGGADVF